MVSGDSFDLLLGLLVLLVVVSFATPACILAGIWLVDLAGRWLPLAQVRRYTVQRRPAPDPPLVRQEYNRRN